LAWPRRRLLTTTEEDVREFQVELQRKLTGQGV